MEIASYMHLIASNLDQNTNQKFDQLIKSQMKNGSKDQKLHVIYDQWKLNPKYI